MQVPGNHALFHRQNDLDQAGNPCGRLQVPDVGLHRADQQRVLRFASLAVHRCRRLHFDRVPQLRCGSVGFQIVHVRRRHARPGQGLLDHPLLHRTVGHRRPRARPVLVDRRATNHPPNPVAVGLRVAEPLQDDHAAALTPREAVRRGIEGPACTRPRQHPQIRHLSDDPGRQDCTRASDQGHIHFAPLQTRDRVMQRDQ